MSSYGKKPPVAQPIVPEFEPEPLEPDVPPVPPEQEPPANPWVKGIGIAVALLVLALVGYYVLPTWLYRPHVIHYAALVRPDGRVEGNAPFIPIDSIFLVDSVAMERGQGADLPLKIENDPTHDGKPYEFLWQLAPEPKVGFMIPERHLKIVAARQQLDSLSKVFAGHRPRVYSILPLVDNTNGIDTAWANYIRLNVGELGVGKILARGDGLNAAFGFISKADYLQRCPNTVVKVPITADAAARDSSLREFEKCLATVTALSKELPSSSVATGLFDQLKERIGENLLVVVFSDGIENYAETYDWYKKDRNALDKANWKATCQGVQKFLKIPDLHGVTFEWYAPKGAKDPVLVRQSLDFWQDCLTSYGAKFTAHF